MKKQVPHGPDDQVCPFHKEVMDKVCHKCPLWQQVVGNHPQTGEPVFQEWNCALAHMPMLLINAAQEARQGAAATESFRNEMVTMAHQASADKKYAAAIQQPTIKEINARKDVASRN